MKLLVGYRAADLDGGVEDGNTVCHVLDIYHRHAIEKVFPKAAVICSAHLPLTAPDGSPWTEVRFRTGPKLMSGELSLDLLQECLKTVRTGHARFDGFSLDYIGRERDRNDLLAKVKDFPKRVRSFRAEWPASVPGGHKLMFTSYPGCFCHRRLDEGGLALAEVVTREMKNDELRMKNDGGGPVRLLDMGCGCGLVGLLIADCFRGPQSSDPDSEFSIFNSQFSISGIRPTLVDSHSRAIEAAKENAEKFGVEADCVLSDNGVEGREYDIFVGNPPYYSDYRIADVFLETAARALKPGGICYTVCKNAAGLEPVQRRYFPTVEVIHRRGYAVLRSVMPVG